MTGKFDEPPATNIQEEMFRVNASVFIRVPFTLENTDEVSSLQLRMEYNDGYVAYLNGVEVQRSNVPEFLHSAASSAGRTVIDQLVYRSGAPWPVSAPGQSLHRLTARGAGNDPANWARGAPEPGTVDLITPGDMNRDGRLGMDDVAQFVLGLVDAAAYEAAFDLPARLLGDLDGDGDTDFDDISRLVAELDGLAGSTRAGADEVVGGVTIVSPARTDSSVTLRRRSAQSAAATDAVFGRDGLGLLARRASE